MSLRVRSMHTAHPASQNTEKSHKKLSALLLSLFSSFVSAHEGYTNGRATRDAVRSFGVVHATRGTGICIYLYQSLMLTSTLNTRSTHS